LTKEGYIALKAHPKYVIDVKIKGGSVKDGSHVVLSNSSSKSFVKSNFAKWKIISLNKKHHSMYLNYISYDCYIILDSENHLSY
jgi:hypothetical protein